MGRHVCAIVLAAGTGSRFGATKQLLPFRGVPIVARAVDIATKVCGDRTLVVLGHDAAAVAAACRGMPGFVTVNDDYSSGIGASIAAAVSRVRHCADAVLLLLADQPLITEEHLRRMARAWSGSEDEIVATAFANTLGPPVLFGPGCFDDLAALSGDNGGRSLLGNDRYRVTSLEFEPAAIDVDTPGDLETLRGMGR